MPRPRSSLGAELLRIWDGLDRTDRCSSPTTSRRRLRCRTGSGDDAPTRRGSGPSTGSTCRARATSTRSASPTSSASCTRRSGATLRPRWRRLEPSTPGGRGEDGGVASDGQLHRARSKRSTSTTAVGHGDAAHACPGRSPARERLPPGHADRAAPAPPVLVLNGWRLLLTVVLLVAWEVAATTVTTPFWISQPSRVFDRLIEPDDERPAALARLGDAPGGAARAGARRRGRGRRSGCSRRLPARRRRRRSVVMGLNSLPRVALAPLFIIWFGIGLPSKVILAFSLVVFPVLINTYQGVRGVDQRSGGHAADDAGLAVADRPPGDDPVDAALDLRGAADRARDEPDRRRRRRARRLESRRRLLRRGGGLELRHDRRVRRAGDPDRA